MDAAVEFSFEKSKARWKTAIKDKAFDSIRDRPLVDSRSDNFLRTLTSGTVSTNVHLRRLQNRALDLGWIFEPVLKKKRLFPKPVFKKKRAITQDEHRRITERGGNPERRDFYEVLWFTGGGQSDIAQLDAAQIHWRQRVLTYRRLKNGQPAQIQISEALATVLR